MSTSGQVGRNLITSKKRGCSTLCRILKISAANCSAIDEKDAASRGMILREIGIDQATDFDLQAGFFSSLALSSQRRGFIIVNMTGREAPGVLKRVMPPTNQQQPLPILNQATCANDELAIVDAATPRTNRPLVFIELGL